MSAPHQMHELAPLYALDALEGKEQHDFEAHLETCPECQESLDEYQTVATNLVHDERASDETWERISAAISTEGESASNVVEMPPARNTRTWQWIAGLAAAAALVFGALLAFDGLQADQLGGDDIVAAADRVAGESGALVADFLVDDVSVAQIVLSDDGRGFVIPTDDLAPLDEERTYQLWVVNDTEDVISAGVLGNDPDPATFTWTGDVAGFALTREVAGGVVSSEGDVVSVISDV